MPLDLPSHRRLGNQTATRSTPAMKRGVSARPMAQRGNSSLSPTASRPPTSRARRTVARMHGQGATGARSDYTHSVGFFPDLRTIESTVGLVKHRQAKPPPTYLPTYLALRRPPAANLPTYLVIGGLIRASRPPGAKPTYLPSASRGLRPHDLPIPTYLTRYAVHVDGYCLM